MPKQIKKRQITKGEKTACALTIIAMAISLVFAAAFIIFIPDIESDSRTIQETKAIVLAASYVLLIGMTIAAGTVSLIAHKKSRQAGDLMRGFFSLTAAFLTLLAIRFMLALLFSGLGKEETVDKIVGDNSYSKFIENQAPAFACLVIGLSVILFTGISAIVKLAKR